jgi:O-methyltransferase involved in polyketide biosynthesis
MSINDGPFGAPQEVDLERPSAARVYDWYLGGGCNWAADREFGKRAVATFPRIRQLAVTNRRWLGRVVRTALNAGITQFLDLGSGIPSMGAVHEWVARHPSTKGGRGRVVYVDNEPVAHAHIEQHLSTIEGADDWVVPIYADLRDPELIFGDLEVAELFDLTEPVCVLAVAVLHFVAGDTVVPELLANYRNMVTTGSWLAVSHIAHDAVTDPEEKAQVEDFIESYKDSQNPLYARDHAEITAWMKGWGETLAPGVVPIPDWRPDTAEFGPDTEDVRQFAWCGVAIK